MSTVYWTPSSINFPAANPQGFPPAQLFFEEPEPVYNMLMSKREITPYKSCPAFIDYTKNTYAIKSSFDFNIKCGAKESGQISTDLPAHIYNEFCTNRSNEIGKNDPWMLTFPPKAIFYSLDDVMIEVIPPYLNGDTQINNTNLIPATYNIGKWIRPLDWTFEVIDESKEIKVKKGDVLFYLRFIPADGEKITLERVTESDDLVRLCCGTTNFKLGAPHKSLKELYKIGESYLNWYKNKHHKKEEKKCPFKWLSK